MMPAPSPPDMHRIQTAENVGIGYRIAGLGSRFFAQMIDLLIIVPIGAALAIAGAEIVSALATTDIGSYFGLVGVITVLGVFPYLYFAAFETVWNGQTPGKRALNIRVIRTDGSAIGAGDAMLRNLVRFVDMVLFIGAFVIFGSRRSQRLGDMAARTLVVRTAPQVGLDAAAATPPLLLRTNEGGPALEGINRIGRHEYSILRSFLSRPDLHVMQRRRIAAQMARTLIERMDLPPTAPERTLAPEVLLERLYIQLAQRFGGR